jgi:hypothetical protein
MAKRRGESRFAISVFRRGCVLVAILPVVFLAVDVPARLPEFALHACALACGELSAGAAEEGFVRPNRGLSGGDFSRLAARQFAASDALPDARVLSPLPRVDRP